MLLMCDIGALPPDIDLDPLLSARLTAELIPEELLAALLIFTHREPAKILVEPVPGYQR